MPNVVAENNPSPIHWLIYGVTSTEFERQRLRNQAVSPKEPPMVGGSVMCGLAAARYIEQHSDRVVGTTEIDMLGFCKNPDESRDKLEADAQLIARAIATYAPELCVALDHEVEYVRPIFARADVKVLHLNIV